MYEQSPVIVHSGRTSVARTGNGGEALDSTSSIGSVVVGQSGDVQVQLRHGVTLTVWPNGVVEVRTAADGGITFNVPDLDTIAKVVRLAGGRQFLAMQSL